MGYFVKINQKLEERPMIYYVVSSSDYSENSSFKIGIDIEKKYIYFYKDLNTSIRPIKIIDLNDVDSPIEAFGIPPWILGAVIRKTLKCFCENDFPEDISFCS